MSVTRSKVDLVFLFCKEFFPDRGNTSGTSIQEIRAREKSKPFKNRLLTERENSVYRGINIKEFSKHIA
jgi:hypothetical protein